MGLFSKSTPTITAAPVNGIGSAVSAGSATEQAALAITALSTIAEGVVVIDPNGLVKMLNPAALKLIGEPDANNLVGLAYNSVLKLGAADGAPVPDDQNPFAKAILGGLNWTSREFVLSSLENKQIPVEVIVTPVGGQDNAAVDRIVTFRDIAAEVEHESEQSEFISTASHEMRTPVASIEGYLGLALNPATATIDERAQGYLSAAHQASQHLGKLFQDLLDVTKLDDHRAKLELVPVDVAKTVQEIVTALNPEIMAKQLAMQFHFGAGERGLAATAYAMIDQRCLTEVMNNLVENAIKYTPAGGGITVGVVGENEEVKISVADSGIGIPAEDLEHIFQKFYRVDNSDTREIGGTGLGLYIVKKRVEAMHGRVWAESVQGKGSTFWVALPRLSAAEYERQAMIQRNTAMMSPNNAAAGALGSFAVDNSSFPPQTLGQS